MRLSKVSLLVIVLFVVLVGLMIFLPSYNVPGEEQPETTHVKKNIRFYIYGSIGCPACKAVKRLLEENFKEAEVIFYELSSNEEYVRKFYKIYEIIGEAANKTLAPYTPLIGVLIDNKLTFIVVGFQPLSFWENIVFSGPKDYVVAFYPKNSGMEAIVISSSETVKILEELFRGKGSV